MLTISEVGETTTIFPVTNIVWSGSTQYCKSVIISDSTVYGRMLFLEGELQSTSSDERIYHESLVHPIMANSVQKTSVLVVGGGEGATVREVLRWADVGNVVWVDIDTELVSICKEYLGWAPHVYQDSRVQYKGMDIREYVHSKEQTHFDVIILDLPDPDDMSGYLYSPEFWVDMKKLCRDSDSRIVTHLGPVKPFSGLGAGVEQIWKAVQGSGIEAWKSGFYQITIPSFKHSWGFWISGSSPFIKDPVLPPLLSVVDSEQMRQWMYPPKVWRKAIDSISSTIVYGICNTYE